MTYSVVWGDISVCYTFLHSVASPPWEAIALDMPIYWIDELKHPTSWVLPPPPNFNLTERRKQLTRFSLSMISILGTRAGYRILNNEFEAWCHITSDYADALTFHFEMELDWALQDSHLTKPEAAQQLKGRCQVFQHDVSLVTFKDARRHTCAMSAAQPPATTPQPPPIMPLPFAAAQPPRLITPVVLPMASAIPPPSSLSPSPPPPLHQDKHHPSL